MGIVSTATVVDIVDIEDIDVKCKHLKFEKYQPLQSILFDIDTKVIKNIQR